MDPRAEWQQMVDQDTNEYLAGHVREERARRQAAADVEHQRRVKAAEPSWARWRAERDLGELVRGIADSKEPATAEHRATAERLLAASQGGQK